MRSRSTVAKSERMAPEAQGGHLGHETRTPVPSKGEWGAGVWNATGNVSMRNGSAGSGTASANASSSFGPLAEAAVKAGLPGEQEVTRAYPLAQVCYH